MIFSTLSKSFFDKTSLSLSKVYSSSSFFFIIFQKNRMNRNLNYLFTNKQITKTLHRSLYHLRHGTCNIRKILTNTWIFYAPLRKCCHLHISVAKKLLRVLTEHHNCYILDISKFRWSHQ